MTNAGILLPTVLAPGLLCDERPWAEVQDRLDGPSSIVSLRHANRRLAALIPGAVLTVIPACGHMLPLEAPDAVAGILNSLARGKAA